MTDREADAAGRARELLREQWPSWSRDSTCVLTPTLPCVAPPCASAEDDERRRRLIRFTYTVNALGWPALALPCGAAEDGLPASVQLIGRPGDDARLLAVGAALEAALA